VLCRTASEFFTRAFSPTASALTCETNTQRRLSSSTSAAALLPRATTSMSTTLPRTPRSGPTTSASEAFCSPQTSRFRCTGSGSSVGGVPANRTTPESVPPSFTAISS